MPGNIVVRPIQADLTRDASSIGSMNPYFVVTLDKVKYKSQICKKGGKSPHWRDIITASRVKDQYCIIELRTQSGWLPDKTIGFCQINFRDLPEQKLAKWYDVLYHNKVVGKILIETSLLRTTSSQAQSFYSTGLRSAPRQSLNTIEDRIRFNTEPAYPPRYAQSLGDLNANELVYQFKVSQPSPQIYQNYQQDGLQSRTTLSVTPQDSNRRVTFVDRKSNDKKSEFDGSFVEVPIERTEEERQQRMKFLL